MRAAVLAFALSAFGIMNAGAQSSTASSRAALNGEWTGTLVLDNSQPRVTLVFELTDSAFVGKAYTDGQPFGEMKDGSLDGDKVHFKVDRLDFTGIIKGATMKVDLIVYNGTTRKLTFTKTPSLLPKPPGSGRPSADHADDEVGPDRE